MPLIPFKLLLPPLLIATASLAGRRWGDAIGGWLVGLPLTSGPVSAFLAVQYGAEFAARATDGSLAGTAAQAAFSLAYAGLATRGAAVATLGGTAGYVAAATPDQSLNLPHAAFFALAVAALTAAAAGIPPRRVAAGAVAPPRWDLPARMSVATVLVLTLTALAGFVGPKPAGAMASFPVFGAILAVFAHRTRGAETARQTLRGMVLALYGFAAFFFVLGAVLPRVGVVWAFMAATVAAAAAQAGALAVIRRAR